jgi:hypothetical protein
MNRHLVKQYIQKAKDSFQAAGSCGYNRNNNHNHFARSYHKPPSSSENSIPMDYHLSMPAIIDNPKKLSKFLFIRVIPKGEEFAVYIQNNHLTFYEKRREVPSIVIPHKTEINRTMFMCTKVRNGFFVITDIIFYKGNLMLTHEDRLNALLEIFSKGYLQITNPVTDPTFDQLSFYSANLYCQWTDFTRASLHIPYEIKHLEYCIPTENLHKQSHRFIYILNKKNLKKTPHDAGLVHTISRDFRVDISELCGGGNGEIEDFKTCILNNKPFVNVVGYSHLDKQEESDEE